MQQYAAPSVLTITQAYEADRKYRQIAFWRFSRSSLFSANPLLLGVCGFALKSESQKNRPKIDLAAISCQPLQSAIPLAVYPGRCPGLL